MRRTLLLAPLLVACSSDPAAEPSPPPSGAGPIAFAPCPLHSEGDGPPAECALVAVPLRAEAPDGETIDVHLKRYRPAGGSGKYGVFMLQGGPGGLAYAFESMVEAIGKKYPDVEWYLPDHRGTGKSTRLGCPQEAETTAGGFHIVPLEWKRCLASLRDRWGDRLAAFSTTNAANDLGVLIERARLSPGREQQKSFVYGVSYGTYWAHRYLQLRPKQAAGVVLDSIAPPGSSLARQDEDANTLGRELFAACGSDPFCKSKLGDDPWARATAVFEKLALGHCSDAELPGAPIRFWARRAFGDMAMNFGLRQLIPAVLYRLERCTAADSAVVKSLLTKLYGGPPGGDEMMRQYSFSLANNIMFSELWESPSPTAADLQAIRESAIVSREVTSGMDGLIGTWPTYSDPYIGKWATTDIPMLMLAGGLDPATLLEKQRAFKPHFTGTSQHWIEVPTASHAVIASSVTKTNYSCGTKIFMSFLEHPDAPDRACLGELLPLEFVGQKELNQALLGSDDAWE